MNYSKYKLAIWVPFHPKIHGITSTSDNNICGHFLLHYSIEPYEFLESYEQIVEESLIDTYHYYNDIIIVPHPIIRNYKNIVHSEKYFKIDIIQEDVLDGQEYVGYLKTFWIKLLQRKWKRIFKERQEIIKNMSNPRRMMKREITGK
jgi:hypothetical protein